VPATPTQTRMLHVRTTIHTFIKACLDAKLEKLAEDDPKRTELITQYQPAVWLEDAARRIRQIQAVTHSLKPIHPDARGTNIYIAPEHLPSHIELGSHVLGKDFSADVVGNAAALDVYKFLKLETDGRSLLDGLLAEDADLLHALNEDIAKARQLRDAFVSLVQSDDTQTASHPFAKQLYWLIDEDPTDDAAYHLLAPLYPTSLVHELYNRIQEDRFSEESKAVRQARRDNKFHEGVSREYRNLAVQKLGGTKPQNISQLNSERRGSNYLLSCAPPIWKTSKVRIPLRVNSFIGKIYGNIPEVKKTIETLRQFLENTTRSIMEVRNQRDEYIATLIDELVQLASLYRQDLSPGWSRKHGIELPDDERLWLDPGRAALEGEDDFRKEWLWMDWPNKIGTRFARWVNEKLGSNLFDYKTGKRVPAGDPAFFYWKKELLLDERESGWVKDLYRTCQEIEKRCEALRETSEMEQTEHKA